MNLQNTQVYLFFIIIYLFNVLDYVKLKGATEHLPIMGRFDNN